MICVVGADGFFGTYISQSVINSFPDETLVCLDHSDTCEQNTDKVTHKRLELSDSSSIDSAIMHLSSYDDIRIIFTAASHNPDIIKSDPGKASYINGECYESFLSKLKGLPVKKLIYTSSDTVYGESRNSYAFKEDDTLAPINIYGEHKKRAEEITKKYSFSIARYSYLCAPSVTAKKKHFFDTVASSLKKGEKVFMLTDWVRSAINYKDAADITLRYLFDSRDINVLNIASDEALSKYDIGIRIAEYTGADTDLIIPCTSDELGIFTEKRANVLITDNSLMKKLGFSDSIKLNF